MKCKVVRKNIYDFLEGDILDRELLFSFKQHLEQCNECREYYDNKVKIKEQFNRVLSCEDQLFDSRNEQVMKSINTEYYGGKLCNKLNLFFSRNRLKLISCLSVLVLVIAFTVNLKSNFLNLQQGIFNIEGKLSNRLEISSIEEVSGDVPIGIPLYNNKTLVIDDKNNLKIYDIGTKSYTELNEDADTGLFDYSVSGDRKQILYRYVTSGRKENPYFIYNIETKSKHQLKLNEDVMNLHFDDSGRYLTGEITNGNQEKLVTVDTVKETNQIVDLKNFDFKHNLKPNAPTQVYNTYSSDGQNIFFILTTWDDINPIKRDNVKYGMYMYSAKNPQSAEPLFWLTGNGDYISKYDIINNGKTIIFSGRYYGEAGIYVFDIRSKTINKILPDTAKNILNCNYSLSGDKSRIAYSLMVSKNNDLCTYDVYAGVIVGDKVFGKTIIFRDITSSSDPLNTIYNSTCWSDHNKQLLLSKAEFDPQKAASHPFISYIPQKFKYYKVIFK